MKNGKKIIAILPAYNAEKTLKKTVDDIPKDWIDDIILVDDASSDNTVNLSRSLGLKTFVHKKNLGYGGNQKTCYKEALKLGADIVVMVHPDHQYDPSNIPQAVLPIILNEADAVFGSRMMIPRSTASLTQSVKWGSTFFSCNRPQNQGTWITSSIFLQRPPTSFFN